MGIKKKGMAAVVGGGVLLLKDSRANLFNLTQGWQKRR
jgi:hypothetical protein